MENRISSDFDSGGAWKPPSGAFYWLHARSIFPKQEGREKTNEGRSLNINISKELHRISHSVKYNNTADFRLMAMSLCWYHKVNPKKTHEKFLYSRLFFSFQQNLHKQNTPEMENFWFWFFGFWIFLSWLLAHFVCFRLWLKLKKSCHPQHWSIFLYEAKFTLAMPSNNFLSVKKWERIHLLSLLLAPTSPGP